MYLSTNLCKNLSIYLPPTYLSIYRSIHPSVANPDLFEVICPELELVYEGWSLSDRQEDGRQDSYHMV